MKNLVKIAFIFIFSICLLHAQEHHDDLEYSDKLTNQHVDTTVYQPILIQGSRWTIFNTSPIRFENSLHYYQIEKLPSQDLIGLFRNEGSIDVRSRGNITSQADISIRGGSFEQNLIMLNGIPMNDPQTGHHNMDLPISISDIVDFQTLHGSASRYFGPSAYSGAINISTFRDRSNGITADLTGGSNGYLSTGAGVSLVRNDFDILSDNFISLNYEKSDGYTRNTDFQNFKGYWDGNFYSNGININSQFGYMQKSFGANSFYTTAYPDQYEETRTYLASLSGNYGEKFKIEPSLYWRRHDDKFELFRWEHPDWYKDHNYHETDVLGASIKFLFESTLGSTNLGVNFRSENIKSNVLGTPNGDTIAVSYNDAAKYTRFADRGILNLFLNQNYSYDNLNLSIGALASHSTDYDWNFYPGIDLAYNIDYNFTIFGNVNRSLRLPSFTELYYTDPSNRGNVNLKPEDAITYEAGIDYYFGGISVKSSIFQRMSNNTIDWVKVPGDSLFRCENLTSMTVTGLDLVFGIEPKKIFDSNFPVEKLTISYSYNSLNRNEDNFISEYALDYLRNKINVGITHVLFFDIIASWNIMYNDRAGKYEEYPSGDIKSFDAFALVDLKFSREFKNYSLFLQISNLTDVQYLDFANLTPPGIMVYGGIKLTF